ncbi:MAG: NAD(P)H-hydrate dehydratase [Clostridia bacterium]
MALPKGDSPRHSGKSLPEVVITPYEIIKETVDCGSTIEQSSLAPLREQLAICSAVLAGPGWSQVCYVQELLGVLLDMTPSHIPMVLDADALNILAARPEMAREVCRRGGRTNFSATFGRGGSAPCRSRYRRFLRILMDSVRQLTEKCNACVALKDAVTLVASPEGKLYINQTGNHGMATAGSAMCWQGLLPVWPAQGLSF